MERERMNRYLQKINLAHKRLENIEEEFSDFNREIIKLGIYKAFQELVEVLTDITAMIIIDKKINIGDDYSNLENIKEIIKLSDNETQILKEANGLRNRIIHEYSKTDDQKVKDSIENLVVPLKKILEKISEFINSQNDKTKNKDK